MAHSFLVGALCEDTPALGDRPHLRSHLPRNGRRDQSARSEGTSSGNHPSLGLALTRGYVRVLRVYPGQGITRYPVTGYASERVDRPSDTHREERSKEKGKNKERERREVSNAGAEKRKRRGKERRT